MECAEPVGLLGLFDAFGDDLEVEDVCEVDDGLGDSAVGGRVVEVGDELAVDLEDVDRESAQLAEGAVAGAEVVDGQADSEPFELLEDGDHRVGVGGNRCLGDFEDEVRRIEA